MYRNTFLLVLLAAIVASPAFGQNFDRNAWLADFDQLKSAVTENYPNLEWAAERGADLPAIERSTRDRLAAAPDETSARAALERFVNSFGDGHFSLTWPQPRIALRTPASESLCATMGYRQDDDSSAIGKNLPGYEPLPASESEVDAGMVVFAEKRIATLRISLFQPSLAMCESAVRKFRLPGARACDDACKNKLAARADDIFVREIEGRIRSLMRLKPDVFLVDVAGNGGGSDTAIAIARMLGGEELNSPPMAFVRNAQRRTALAEDLLSLKPGLVKARGAEAAFLSELLAGLTRAQEQAGESCDLTGLWRGEKIQCTNLVRGPFYAGGMVSRELPAAYRSRPWAGQVSSTARFSTSAGIWKGPLVVLVDGSSASATELFAAMLQDAGRAVILGSPTRGSGCGWTLPKRPIELKNSGGELVMPDCARFRRDDRNELDGIEPDELVAFRRTDSVKQRVERVSPKLRNVVSR
jgi:hypothetical protein